MPPPAPFVAVLPLNLELVMVKEPWSMTPPPSVAVFPLTTDVVMVRMPELDMPPPNPFVLVFPLTSDLEIVSVPKFPIPPRPFVLVFALTDDLSIMSVPLLRIPPPSALAVGLAPPVNVRPTTFTEPEETISGVPVPCASSVAGLPIKARSFDTENVPTHVPETKRDAPEEAASIAGCRAVGFTEQSTTTGPLVVTVKLTRLIAVPAGVTTLIGPVVASGGTVACACVSLRKANDEDEALLKFTATPPVKPVREDRHDGADRATDRAECYDGGECRLGERRRQDGEQNCKDHRRRTPGRWIHRPPFPCASSYAMPSRCGRQIGILPAGMRRRFNSITRDCRRSIGRRGRRAPEHQVTAREPRPGSPFRYITALAIDSEQSVSQCQHVLQWRLQVPLPDIATR